MQSLLSNPGFIALMGTLFGGAGLKMIEAWLGRAKARQDAGAAMRAELRLEIEGLRTQLQAADAEEQRLEAEIERWKGLYYDLRDDKQRIVTELQILKSRLEALDKRTQN